MGKFSEGYRTIPISSSFPPPILSFTKFGLYFTQAVKQNIPSRVKHREINSYCAEAGNREFQGIS